MIIASVLLKLYINIFIPDLMSAIQTIIIIMYLDIIYYKQTGDTLQCHSTNWTKLDMGETILFQHTTKVNFICN